MTGGPTGAMLCPLRSDAPPEGYRRNVGIVLLDRRGHIFAGCRQHSRDAWQMPQGGIDKGEAPDEAALRELEEEVGTRKARILRSSEGWLNYDVPTEIAARLWRGKWRGQSQKWFAMRFLGKDRDIDVETKHPEFCGWRWMTADQLLAAIVPFKRDVYTAVLTEFADLLVTGD